MNLTTFAMSLSKSQKAFMRTVVTISADVKIKHANVSTFFESIAELAKDYALLANPLGIRDKSQTKMKAIYLEQIKQYVFHLATIHKTTTLGGFDTHNNLDIKRTYIEQILKYIAIFPDPVCEKLATFAI